jgi:hypothetical protein
MLPDKTIVPVSVEVPEFTRADSNWSYLTLADEQAEPSSAPCTQYHQLHCRLCKRFLAQTLKKLV